MAQINPRVIGGTAAAVLAGLLAFTKPWEGEPTIGYSDPVGVATACVGHTGGVVVGRRYTPEQCWGWFVTDALEAFSGAQRCIRPSLSVGGWIAVSDFVFNEGERRLCQSTAARLANAGKPPSVWCPYLRRYIYAGGRILPGLVKRRAAEVVLCLKP